MDNVDLDLEETFEFLPMWNTRERVVVGYICSTKHNQQSFRYDLFSMMSALTSIARTENSPAPALIATPIHLSNLRLGNNRAHFATIGQQSNAKIRERLVVELVLGDDAADVEAVSDAIECIRAVCRTILLRVPIEYADIGVLASFSVYGIGTKLDRSRTPEYLHLLENFVEQTDSLGLRSYILGLDSMPALTATICAGFGHVNGPSVPRVGDGEMTYPLAIADLYGAGHGGPKLPPAHQRQVVAADLR